MIYKIEAGTDIATIGIWDLLVADTSVHQLKFADYEAEIAKRATASELFFTNTSADGAYTAWIYFDEPPSQDLENDYKEIAGPFFLKCTSGQLCFEGLEYYGHQANEFDETHFELPIGDYSLRVFQLTADEETFAERVRAEVGDEAYDHYEKQFRGCNIAFFLFITGFVLAVYWKWYFAGLMALSLLILYLMSKRQHDDPVFQQVQKAIEEMDANHPVFVFVFEPVDSIGESRGYFEMEY